MKFNNKLYELRKQEGFSQDELGSKLNVSRQTVSKWELGETTPELEKLIALSDLFHISLDELVLDVKKNESDNANVKAESSDKYSLSKLIERITTEKNKIASKKVLKIVLIIIAIVFAIDITSMIIYFLFHGIPS